MWHLVVARTAYTSDTTCMLHAPRYMREVSQQVIISEFDEQAICVQAQKRKEKQAAWTAWQTFLQQQR